MPFVTQQVRDLLAFGANPREPGDRCYLQYKRMVKIWKETPRWTTANNIYKEMIESRPYKTLDESVAEELAWQVFFNIHVMEYEQKKRQENGDI